MENILQNIPHVCIYLDDILIMGKTDAEHLNTLNEELKWSWSEAGGANVFLCCQWWNTWGRAFQQMHGVCPTKDKIRAIVDAPHHKTLHS